MALGCFGDIIRRSANTPYSTYLRGTISLKVLPCPELSILGRGFRTFIDLLEVRIIVYKGLY